MVGIHDITVFVRRGGRAGVEATVGVSPGVSLDGPFAGPGAAVIQNVKLGDGPCE